MAHPKVWSLIIQSYEGINSWYLVIKTMSEGSTNIGKNMERVVKSPSLNHHKIPS
jgi:hypothetical protein